MTSMPTLRNERRHFSAYWFYVNSWGRAKIEQLEIVSECESSGTIFMYYRTEFFS